MIDLKTVTKNELSNILEQYETMVNCKKSLGIKYADLYNLCKKYRINTDKYKLDKLGKYDLLSKDECLELSKKYKTIKDIGIALDIEETTICRMFKTNGIPSRMSKYNDFKNIPTEEIIAKRKELGSVKATLKYYDVPYHIYHYKINFSCPLEDSRTYSVNDDFFSEDNEASMYFSGILATDGWVSSKAWAADYNTIGLCLNNQDMTTLETFKQHIQFDGPITRHSDRASKIVITSQEMCRDLLRFGIVRRKSLIFNFPDFVKTHSMARHFYRGMIDGDGCFTLVKPSTDRNLVQRVFCMIGTYSTAMAFKELTSSLIGREAGCLHQRDKNKNTWQFRLAGNKVVKILADYLYKDATIYMQRKYDVAHTYIPENTHKRPRNIEVSGQKIIATNTETGNRKLYASLTDAQGDIGCDRHIISDILKGKRSGWQNYTFERPVTIPTNT